LHVLAKHLEKSARDLARGFQADEAGLLRLLPRLPTLLMLQDVVNGLVTHATDAMTTGGRRPQLVRWNWKRDMTHRFRYREKAMSLFVDGAVTLCIRTHQSDGGLLDQWYGFFILLTELEDERVMRLRLERLLCWRESPERWNSYSHMLPILILANSGFAHGRNGKSEEESSPNGFVMPSPCNTFLMEGKGRCILARGCKFRNETGDFFENILWMS
jgi:hypothetical protein